MDPLSIDLAPIKVVAQAEERYEQLAFLRRQRFYRRQRATSGHMFGPETVERHRLFANRVVDYLKVELPFVRMAGKALRLRCGRPRVFIDDVRLLGDPFVDEAIQAQDVLAIEMYDGAVGVPVVYGSCSVLLWTRTKARR